MRETGAVVYPAPETAAKQSIAVDTQQRPRFSLWSKRFALSCFNNKCARPYGLASRLLFNRFLITAPFGRGS